MNDWNQKAMSVPELIEYLKIEEDLAKGRRCVRVLHHFFYEATADNYR